MGILKIYTFEFTEVTVQCKYRYFFYYLMKALNKSCKAYIMEKL